MIFQYFSPSIQCPHNLDISSITYASKPAAFETGLDLGLQSVALGRILADHGIGVDMSRVFGQIPSIFGHVVSA